MSIRDQGLELCPIVIADQVRELAANLHFEVIARTGDFALGMFERISTQVGQLQQQYEGELIDRTIRLLEIVENILTMPDDEYDAQYLDIWNPACQLDREIVLSYNLTRPCQH